MMYSVYTPVLYSHLLRNMLVKLKCKQDQYTAILDYQGEDIDTNQYVSVCVSTCSVFGLYVSHTVHHGYNSVNLPLNCRGWYDYSHVYIKLYNKTISIVNSLFDQCIHPGLSRLGTLPANISMHLFLCQLNTIY